MTPEELQTLTTFKPGRGGARLTFTDDGSLIVHWVPGCDQPTDHPDACRRAIALIREWRDNPTPLVSR